MNLSVDKILPNPEQPRVEFNYDELCDLAESIKAHGIIQPLVVEAVNGHYILHDGERRLRAAKLAGYSEVPVHIVATTSSKDRLERAIIANVQRQDLGPIEEAQAYQSLRQDHNLSILETARKIGVPASRVKAKLELLELEPEIQKLFSHGLTSDRRVVVALKQLSPDVRKHVANMLATRESGPTAALKAIQTIVQHMTDHSGRINDTPSIALVKRHVVLNKPKWDVFVYLGKLPPWSMTESAARDTCDACGIRGSASETTCRDCPMVEILRRMIQRSNG